MKETVLITGGSSMIGKQLIPILKSDGYNVLAPTKDEMNCMVLQAVYDYFDKYKPKYIFHLSGFNGGISFNAKYPADIYFQTAWMALSVLSAASFYSDKVVSVLPSCAYYPYYRRLTIEDGMTKDVDEIPAQLLCEKEFESGEPHPSVACHGLSKRILFDYSRQMNKQFKMNAVCCVLNNCYGPYARHDEPERLKVADNLIQKFCDAKQKKRSTKLDITDKDPVIVWGTGSPRRELLFSKDAAEGIYKVFQHYDNPQEVINVGSGTDVSIKDLAEKIRDIVDPEIQIVYDTSKPDGQMKKLFDNSKMKELLRWEPKTSLEDGLRETIEWYNKFRGYV